MIKIKSCRIALFFYFIAILATIAGSLFSEELLLMIAKPLIVPAIYYYYVLNTKKINFLLTLALLAYFITDMIILSDYSSNTYWILLFNSIANIIFLKFVLIDLITYQAKFKIIVYSFLVLIVNIIILKLTLEFVDENSNPLSVMYVMYGSIVILLCSVTVYNFLNVRDLKNTYALIMSGCFITSDIFYSLYHSFPKIESFLILNNILQFSSYFFIVKFFLTRKNLLV